MKNYFFFLLFVFNVGSATAQTYSSVTSDKEIYDFINWLVLNDNESIIKRRSKRKRIACTINTWDSANFIQNDTSELKFIADFKYLYKQKQGTDTLFNQENRDYIYQQFLGIKDSSWHDSFVESSLVNPSKLKRADFYAYSIPLFSLDKNYVIVNRLYICGNLCASEGKYVYKRIDDSDQWELVTIVNGWVS